MLFSSSVNRAIILTDRIVLLHLDSLSCLPALDLLFGRLGNRICLVVASNRFGGPAGGFWRQLWRNVQRSGARFTFALGFDVVAPNVIRRIRRFVPVGGRLTAREHATLKGLPYVVAANVNSSDIVALIRAKAPTLILSMHFDQILDRTFISQVGVPILNIHPGRLPFRRGPCPSFWALHDGDPYAEVSLHRIEDETIDNGEVLLRRGLGTAPAVSMAKLDAVLFKLGVKLLFEGSAVPGNLLLSRDTMVSSEVKRAYQSFPDRHAVRRANVGRVRLLRVRDIIDFIWSKREQFG